MKKQIEEVQNYFINKITACEFDSCTISSLNAEWTTLDTIIDGYSFRFSVHPKENIFCWHTGFIELKVPNDRLENLIALVKAEADL